MSELVVGYGTSRQLSDREIAYAIESLFQKVGFKFVTERECVERERAAFVAGAIWGDKHRLEFNEVRTEAPEFEAARRYPLPKGGQP